MLSFHAPLPIYAHFEKSRDSTRLSSPVTGPTSVSAVESTDERWETGSGAVLVRKFATEDRRRLLMLSRMFTPFEVPGGEVAADPGVFGAYRSLILLMACNLLRQDETLSPPSRFDQTKENTDALRASSRMNPGRAARLMILVSAAGDISGKPGLLMTCTL